MTPKSSLSSFPWENPPAGKLSRSKTGAAGRRNELWLAVHLPRLDLEVVTTDKGLSPIVVVEEAGGRQTVYMASLLAQRANIAAGMSLSAACALCPDLAIHPVQPLARQQRLESIANWAFQYSPRVSLQVPCSFLLEVKGSIQYFGSLETIQERIAGALKNKWQHEYCLAISPTPTASILLAESANEAVVHDISDLRSVLGKLSINLLPLDKKRKQQLAKIGVHVLRDLWRLPAPELARRFGTDLVDYLGRALGELPHYPPLYQSSLCFEAAHDIAHEAYNYQLLLSCAHKLLQDLCVFLKTHDVYTSHFFFYFHHARHEPTMITVELRQQLRDPAHFMLLFETRISQMKLPAPVRSIRLLAGALHAFTTKTTDLFPAHGSRAGMGQNIEHLLEQLYARLGHQAITGISTHADHRPEYAHRISEPGPVLYACMKRPRPFWLFPSPIPLLKKNDRLYYKSSIRFSMGPERIEAGWWDGDDIHRDYYIGIDRVAGSLWIYHDLKDRQRWYLHGLFG